MKFLIKSQQLALQLFPPAYSVRHKYQTFHFAFIWKRNQLLSIGQNNMSVDNAKARKFSELFQTNQKYDTIHAEIDAISKLWGKYYIDNSLKMVVLRLNKNLKFGMSKPCRNCRIVLDGLSLNNVYYSDRLGDITDA